MMPLTCIRCTYSIAHVLLHYTILFSVCIIPFCVCTLWLWLHNPTRFKMTARVFG